MGEGGVEGVEMEDGGGALLGGGGEWVSSDQLRLIREGGKKSIETCFGDNEVVE